MVSEELGRYSSVWFCYQQYLNKTQELSSASHTYASSSFCQCLTSFHLNPHASRAVQTQGNECNASQSLVISIEQIAPSSQPTFWSRTV